MPDSNSPLNMGAPWNALSQLPGETPIPELENLRVGLQAALQPAGQISPEITAETDRALQNLRNLQATKVAIDKANAQPPIPHDLAFHTDPKTGSTTVDVKMSKDTYEAVLRDRQELNEIRGAFAQEAQRLQVRQRIAEGQPWMQLATALSANLAQAPDMPGWVRAAGRTSAQLNPTADELRNQRLAVLGKQADISEKAGALDIAAARTLEEKAMRAQNEVAATENQRLRNIEKVYDNLTESIKQGPGALDAKTAAAVLVKAGANPGEVQTYLANLGMLAKNVGTKFDVGREDVKNAQKQAADREDRLARQFIQGQTNLETRQQERLGQQEFFSQKTDYNKNTALSVSENQTIQSAFNVLNLVDKIDTAAKPLPTGPIGGRVQYANPYRPGEWQTIKNYADQLLLSGLAGKLGSGVSDRDVEVMRGVTPTGKLTKEQFDATTKVLRSVNADNLRRMMQLNPNVQTWKTMGPLFQKAGLGAIHAQGMDEMKDQLAASYPALFGPDRPEIADRTYGPDTRAGSEATVSGPAPGARDAGGPRQKVTKYPWEK